MNQGTSFPALALLALFSSAGGCGQAAEKGGATAAPARATPDDVSAPRERQAEPALVSDRKLLCARIGMATRGLEASAMLPLEGRAPEGAGASVYVRDDYLRIDGELLGESVREHFDLRFHGGDLVCSRMITTSVWTIMERTEENPQGRPSFWRADFRIYAGGELVHATADEAPGPDEDARDAEATIQLAAELFQRYELAPAEQN